MRTERTVATAGRAAPPVVTDRWPGLSESGPLTRFYELGKRAQWSADDVAWDLPLVPAKRMTDRRRAVWRSVITQQYQADMFAVRIGAQLLSMAPEMAAQLYYSVMMQDEARHVEIWTRMAGGLGGISETDPYITEMGEWVLDIQDIELKVLTFQVFFEGMAIDAFREISAAVPGTTLADVSERLAKDDAIHHGFGLAYARVLLDDASPALIRHINETMARFWVLYRAHTMWRPAERRWMAGLMSQHDLERVTRRSAFVRRLSAELGLEFPAEV